MALQAGLVQVQVMSGLVQVQVQVVSGLVSGADWTRLGSAADRSLLVRITRATTLHTHSFLSGRLSLKIRRIRVFNL